MTLLNPQFSAVAEYPINPIFLVGAECSGTTLFRLMLAQHPAVGVCPGFENALDPLVNKKVWPKTNHYVDQISHNWILRDQGFSIDRSLTVPQLIDSFLFQTMKLRAAEQVVAVVHRNIEVVGKLWGRARYIHIVRDPRDVARSNLKMGWAGHIWHGVTQWLEVEQAWDRLKKQLPNNAYVEISLEELSQAPESVLARVCSFMNIDYNPAMLDFPQNSAYSLPDPDLTQQWRERLAPNEVQLVEARVGDLMLQRGYSHSGLGKEHPGVFARFKFLVENKIRKLLFRLDSYGFRLFVEELISRRLGLKWWRQRLDSQLYVKWRSSLK